MVIPNPIIAGFHPDPSVCRVGDEYLVVASSFTYFPGIPIFRSSDLRDWEQIGNVLDRTSQLDLSTALGTMSRGLYAPTIRHRDGRFWMINTIRSDTAFTNFFVTATDPSGPWSDPIVVEIMGIDPDIAWDGDGNCWVHYAGFGGIERCRIDDSTGEVLDAPEATWNGSGLAYPEAPHLYEIDGTWYLLIAEGGTERGHAISIARGPTPTGPWEPCPANPILSHRSTSSPVQNTGHGDLVQAVDGTWWMVLLGVRPRGGTPGYHVLGRETFLAPVEWVDGWPVVAPIELDAEPQPARAAWRDDFDGAVLGPEWIAIRRPSVEFASLGARPGTLTITGTEATLDTTMPAFVGRRQQHHHVRVRTSIDVGAAGEAGLAVVMDERSHYEVAVTGDRVIVRARIGPLQSVVGEAPRPGGPVVVQVETGGTFEGGPDAVHLGFDDDGEFRELAVLDGRYLSTEVASGYIGRVIGLYATGGDAAFDWIEYEPLDG